MDKPRPKLHSIPLRARAVPQARTTSAYDLAQTKRNTTDAFEAEEDEQAPDMLPPRMPRSALRYTDPRGRDVIQQGNQRAVIRRAKARTSPHWLSLVGLGMLVMLVLVLLGLQLWTWWQSHQLDTTYSFPRYWQTDQVLGLDHDSQAHPSHLIFQNLNGRVFFLVIPAGDFAQARLYPVVTLHGEDAATVPVTASFRDVTGDHKIDILVQVGDQIIVFVNTGDGFKPEQ